MKHKILICLPIVSVLILLSCSNESTSENDFVYPLSVGNSWEYNREWTLYFYTDTVNPSPQYIDTVQVYNTTISVTIPRTVILEDSLETYELVGTDNDSSGPYTTAKYYNETDEGLYLYGYVMGGGLFVCPKTTQIDHISFKGMEFNSYRELTNFIQNITFFRQSYSDSILIEETPVRVLQYPLNVGNQWTFRQEPISIKIDKKVLGKTTIELDSGLFDCYKIKYIYDLDNDGIWDDDIWIDDFISQSGLIKREVTIIGMKESTVGNPDGTERYINSIDIMQLTSYDIEN